MSLKSDVMLKDYQKEAIDKVVNKNGNLLISHPVGSGKTLTGIAAFEALKTSGKANRALIVTPASLRNNFGYNGIKKFTTDDFVIYGTKQEIGKPKMVNIDYTYKPPTYGIVSYDLFRKNPEKFIKQHNADTVIFDEIHKIKNDTSLTYEQLKQSRPLYKNFIGLTGSVVSNTPADIVPLVDTMTNGNHILGNKLSFENRFIVDTREGKHLKHPERVSVLLSPYVHHITMNDVVSTAAVPEKVINEINVPMSPYQTKLYRFIINDLDPVTKAKLKMNVGKLSNADLKTIFTKLIKARQVSNSIAAFDKNISLEESAIQTPKIKQAIDDIQKHLNTVSDAQIVVHSNLLVGGLDVIEAGLKAKGIPYEKFIGVGNIGITDAKRQEAVNKFNSGQVKVLLISAAGGEGLNLPNTTLFINLDGHYNPEKIFQAEARGIRSGGLAHRPLNDRKVLVNRYKSVLPVNKTEFIYDTYQALNPSLYLDRFIRGEDIFINPFKRIKGSDEIMYEIAKRKDVLNKQLTGGFKKTAKLAPGVYSDSKILGDYFVKFEPELNTGNYTDQWIDEKQEHPYINKLRNFYTEAAKPNGVVNILPNKKNTMILTPTYTTGMTGKNVFLQKLKGLSIPLGASMLTAGVLYKLNLHNYKKFFPELPTAEKKWRSFRKTIPLLLLPSFAMYSTIKDSIKPHFLITRAKAKKRLKFTDLELLKLLRGQAVTKETIKDDTHYIV